MDAYSSACESPHVSEPALVVESTRAIRLWNLLRGLFPPLF
jgi:hypothetical protein